MAAKKWIWGAGILGVLALVSAMSSCGGDNYWISQARKVVTEAANDPSSVQFRREFVHRSDGVIVACGEVNARNRMGGMTGFTPFAYQFGVNGYRADLMVLGAPGVSEYTLRLACGLEQMPPPR